MTTIDRGTPPAGGRRLYTYVGPARIAASVDRAARGRAVCARADLAAASGDEPMTFVLDEEGVLRVADRRSEHVACAGGVRVLAAGELRVAHRADDVYVVEISNQSTGYCPEPSSWPAVAAALDAAGIAHPGRYTFAAIFRRCVGCGSTNLVKDAWYVCAVCDADLPLAWNFDAPRT